MALTPNEVTDESVAEGSAWPTDPDEVAAWVNQRKKKAESSLSEWYEAARTDFGFYEGKQWNETDVAKMEAEKRVAVTFNRIAATVNSICGQEVCNRQEVRFLPRRVGEVSAADPMNDAVRWIRDNCNAEDEDSDAFKDMVICGMGWTCSRMDYEDNPAGEGKVERRDPMLMRWDPAARRKNLADKKWVQADYWMTKSAIQDRWPKADLGALVNLAQSERNDPVDVTESWKYNKEATGQESHQDQWRVMHHVERFTKVVHRALDPFSGQIKTFEPDQFKAIQAKAQEGGVQLTSTETHVKVYWEAWVVGKVVLEAKLSQLAQDFQYQAMTCYRERETGYWFGVVRLMLDPQRYANRMASLLMSILSTGAKGGVLFETGAFANPQKAKKDWARWDSAIELNDGALAGGKVQPKAPVQLPQGASDFMQFAISSIRDVTGANLEVLGQRGEDQPGIVEEMRSKAGLTILASVFDAIRLYRKRQGILLAEFVTKFLSDGRLIRIWGAQGQQFIPLVRQPDVTEYDVVVDESPSSRDVKQRTYQVLAPIIPGLMQMGVPIPPETMDYLPIPESLAMQFKKGLLQKSQQPPQPNPEVLKAQAESQGRIQEAQMKGNIELQVESQRAETARQSELARLQADVGVQQHAAEVKAQVERERISMEMAQRQQEHQLTLDAEMKKAALDAETKIRVAQIGAGLPPETPQESQQRVAQETGSISEIAQAILSSQAQFMDAMRQHADLQAQMHQALVGQMAQAQNQEHMVVRDPVSGRAVGRKPVPRGTLQ